MARPSHGRPCGSGTRRRRIRGNLDRKSQQEALPDSNRPKAEKTNNEDRSLPSVAEREVQPRNDKQPKQPNTNKRRAQEDKRPTYKALWREIRIIDVINCLLGVAMLLVAIAAYRIAGDTSDIKSAISNLSDLAIQTKRQADAMSDQLAAVREQVAALKEQAAEAKLQTDAISQQTAAIKATSDANIKSAQAQQTLAEITARAQRPDVDLVELEISGFNTPDKDGIVPVNLTWRFRNTGGRYPYAGGRLALLSMLEIAV